MGPLGVFDSGLGGLTVLQQIREPSLTWTCVTWEITPAFPTATVPLKPFTNLPGKGSIPF